MKTESAKRRTVDQRLSAIDALLDHALEETFPASDPLAVMVDSVLHDRAQKTPKSGDH